MAGSACGSWQSGHDQRPCDEPRGLRTRSRPTCAERALATFGLIPADLADHFHDQALTGESLTTWAERLDIQLRPGQVGSITGPSGAGKSTLLRAVVVRARARGERIVDARALAMSTAGDVRAVVERVVDALCGGKRPSDRRLSAAIGILASAGLGEAALLAKACAVLSDGQRARLGIALAMAECERAQAREPGPILVTIDELCSGLDRLTAAGLCAGIAGWVKRSPSVRLIAAGVDPTLGSGLQASVNAQVDMRGRVSLGLGTSVPAHQHIQIRPGTMAEYDQLGCWHYRSQRPAVPVRVLSAVYIHPEIAADDGGVLVGVLVTAMPTLNARWRDIVWPGRYSGATGKASSARRINDELRCIARVIVEPRFRSMGVATALVRRYLSVPDTPATEAVAAMGAASPMFSRAGMREYAMPMLAADARLLDALAYLDLSPGMLLEAKVDPGSMLEAELRRWAGSSRATRSAGRGATGQQLAMMAARRVLCRARVYAHVTGMEV